MPIRDIVRGIESSRCAALTLINPCVPPLLPVVIAAAFRNSRLGPLALAAGLTLSFAVLGVSVTAFSHLASISPDIVNRAAAIAPMLPTPMKAIPVY